MGINWLIASNNRGKSDDLRRCLAYYGVSASQYLTRYPRLAFPVETTTSYVDNAVGKARFAAQALQQPVIADDSGLELPARPDIFGVTTARDLGVQTSGFERNRELITTLKALPLAQRCATMRATLAAAWPDGRVVVAQATVTGYLLPVQIGQYSGGFDRLFWLPHFGRTLAELPDQWRIPLSHRGQAAQQLKQQL
jgi:XTP/dITP diphosphohydrolase